MQIEGSTFIVTGGASGLGAATARMIVGAGRQRRHRRPQGKPKARRSRNRSAGDAVFVRTDVTDEASANAAVAAAVQGFGGLQGLVNCAGIVHGEKVVGKEGAAFACGLRARHQHQSGRHVQHDAPRVCRDGDGRIRTPKASAA